MTGSGAQARPRVGITTYLEPIARGDWVGLPSANLPANYVEKVLAAGGVPLLIAPVPQPDRQWAGAVLDAVDALIVSGGSDLDSDWYGQQPHPKAQPSHRVRDASEFALVAEAIDRDLPLLGICRGAQVMAVAAGGSLIQHVPDEVGHDEHSPTPGVFGSHPVRIDPTSTLAGVLGEHVEVPTYHHQAVQSHPGYQAVAWAPDGVIEALEDPDARWRVGVQWHPEAGDDPRIFEALVDAAAGASR